MLKSMRKFKNRYFYHIFVSPGDAPRAITLNVVSIEREFDACLQIISLHVPIYLQQFHSYSNRKCKKIAVFTYSSPHFCFPWRRPCDYHAICCMDRKTIQCLSNPSQQVQFPSYSNRKCKNRSFHVPQPHFCLPWRRPCDYHAICCMDGKTIQCAKPLAVCTYLYLIVSELYDA